MEGTAFGFMIEHTTHDEIVFLLALRCFIWAFVFLWQE